MQGGDHRWIILILIMDSIFLGLQRVDSTIGKLGTFTGGFEINITIRKVNVIEFPCMIPPNVGWEKEEDTNH